MRDRPDDLIAAIAISVALALIIQFEPASPVRIALGLIFLLFLPGYVTAAAILPDKTSIDIIERIALSIGLSVATVPLIGLFLFKSFGTLEFWTMVTVLTAFVLIVTFIAWMRRINLPPDERFTIDAVIELNPAKLPLVDKFLVMGIAVAIAVLLVMLALIASAPVKREGFSILGLIGPEGDIKGYPTYMTTDETGSVNVTVESHELSSTSYSLVVLLQDENHTGINITAWRGGNPFSGVQILDDGLAMAYNFTLQPDRFMNSSIDFRVGENGTYKLRFMLFYEGGDPNGEPSYENYLWLKVRPE
jgi:uncharacterized membrane protein